MFHTLHQAEQYFNIKAENEKILKRVTEDLKEQQPNDNYNALDRLREMYIPLVSGEASRLARITRILNYISWKKNLIKYDIVQDGEDVIIHWESKTEHQYLQTEW